jgi:hypothetical protein
VVRTGRHLVGAILHVLYAEEEKTLARVATFLSDPERSFAQAVAEVLEAVRGIIWTRRRGMRPFRAPGDPMPAITTVAFLLKF